ncbi:MAG: c-type cytochrome [Anaerolineae bacterium]|nr:c-type cytochrome [Anaerolineae bacterium]
MAKTQTHHDGYQRFKPSQRFEHIIVILTFTVLALTGIPQKFSSHDWAKSMIDFLGGIESVRIVHRIMATLLVAESIYHGGILSYKIYVLGQRLTMIPGIKDARDVWDYIRYNLGWSKEHPHMPRYNFGEKAEYLAMVWGTLIMVLTGFMLWNPIGTAAILPGAWIPAAKAAHGAEAVLAVLSIITWHMYNVHVKMLNKSMFTGKLTHGQMKEEHGAELAEIEAGRTWPLPPPEVIQKRRRVFLPYAVVMSIILVAGLIYFVSFEESAISTVPRLSAAGETIDVHPDIGDPVIGAQLWTATGCDACHGARGEGTEGLANFSIAGTSLSFEAFATSVRRGPAEMPAYGKQQLSDEDLAHLWVWLTTKE